MQPKGGRFPTLSSAGGTFPPGPPRCGRSAPPPPPPRTKRFPVPPPSFPTTPPQGLLQFLIPPIRSPPPPYPLPLHKPPYPKSLWGTSPRLVPRAELCAVLGKSAPCSLCHPGRGPLPFRSPLPLRNFSGVWGRSRPQPGVQGRGRPWPWRSQCRPLPCLHTKRPPLGAVA